MRRRERERKKITFGDHYNESEDEELENEDSSSGIDSDEIGLDSTPADTDRSVSFNLFLARIPSKMAKILP